MNISLVFCFQCSCVSPLLASKMDGCTMEHFFSVGGRNMRYPSHFCDFEGFIIAVRRK